MAATDEQKCIEWLERLDIPVEETATVERLTRYLIDELGYGDAQIDALIEAADFTYIDLASVGIHPFTIKFPWGKDVRYGITGAPGAWGFEHMMEFYYRRKEEEE